MATLITAKTYGMLHGSNVNDSLSHQLIFSCYTISGDAHSPGPLSPMQRWSLETCSVIMTCSQSFEALSLGDRELTRQAQYILPSP